MGERGWLTSMGIAVTFVAVICLAAVYLGFCLGRQVVENRTVVTPTIKVEPSNISVQPKVTVEAPNITVPVPEVNVTAPEGNGLKSTPELLKFIEQTGNLQLETMKEIIAACARTREEIAGTREAIKATQAEVMRSRELIKVPEFKQKDPEGELLPPPKAR